MAKMTSWCDECGKYTRLVRRPVTVMIGGKPLKGGETVECINAHKHGKKKKVA